MLDSTNDSLSAPTPHRGTRARTTAPRRRPRVRTSWEHVDAQFFVGLETLDRPGDFPQDAVSFGVFVGLRVDNSEHEVLRCTDRGEVRWGRVEQVRHATTHTQRRLLMHRNRSVRALVPPLLVVALLVVLLILSRGGYLLSHATFNPDEAELLASARRANLNLVPYSTYTGGTLLFLWPFSLALLSKFGVPLTLPTAHILVGIAYVWIAFAGWYVISRAAGWIWAGFLVLPTTLYIFVSTVGLGGQTTGRQDFLSLGTELLPLSILILAAVILLAPASCPTRRRIAVIALLAGLSVWAKPQILPLAIALLFVAVVMKNLLPGEKNTGGATSSSRDALVAVGAFLLPSAVFLAVMAIAGTFNSFLQEPVRFLTAYVGSRVTTGGVSPTFSGRVGSATTFILQYPMSIPWALAGLIGWGSLSFGSRSRSRWLAVAAWIAPLLACYFTLLLAFPLFAHYANIVYAAALLSGMVGATISRHFGRTRPIPKSVTSPAFLTFSLVAISSLAVWSTSIPLPAATAAPHVRSTIGRVCPPRSQVLVWGWSAELYAAYDWVPASRYVDSSWQILPTKGQRYYKQTLIRELQTDPPKCIVEAVGPQFFGGLTAADTITQVMPTTGSFIARCYDARPVELSDTRTVTVLHRLARC